MSSFDIDQWRLGHRRPWWQWNVLTLFVALFVLVWVRELMPLPVGAGLTFGFTGGFLIFACWLITPIFHASSRRLRVRLRHWPNWAFYIALCSLFLLLGMGLGGMMF